VSAELAVLEQQRRRALKKVGIAALLAVGGFPLGALIGAGIGTDAAIIVAEGLWLLAFLSLFAGPMFVADWRRSVTAGLLDAAVKATPGVHRIDGERSRSDLHTETMSPGLFQGSGLVETFYSTKLFNALTGQSRGVPFTLADLSFYDQKNLRVFGGVLGSFRLRRSRPGLTIVTRDRGMLGNLLSRTGGALEPVTLEDVHFEDIFEAYGTDQVQSRVILTTTMLERLKVLDDFAHARGFSCAFRGDHLLVALPGMRWRCQMWRLFQPMEQWLPAYRDWINGLIALPAQVAATLDLTEEDEAPAVPAPPARQFRGGFGRDDVEAAAALAWRIAGEAGPALYLAMSGAVFGGLALYVGWYGITEGFGDQFFWYFWSLVTAGLVYGASTIGYALRQLGRFAWNWGSPLRSMPVHPRRRSDRIA
jgi:hypothetical protein